MQLVGYLQLVTRRPKWKEYQPLTQSSPTTYFSSRPFTNADVSSALAFGKYYNRRDSTCTCGIGHTGSTKSQYFSTGWVCWRVSIHNMNAMLRHVTDEHINLASACLTDLKSSFLIKYRKTTQITQHLSCWNSTDDKPMKSTSVVRIHSQHKELLTSSQTYRCIM